MSPRRGRRRLASGGALIGLLAWASPEARADEPSASPPPAAAPDSAAAHALFDEGRALLAQGRVAEACARFEAAHALSPLPGVQLNMASCHERLGRVATAWAEFREALSVAKSDGRGDRVAFAEERLAALAPRVPRLVVKAPEGVAAVVRRDGVILPAASLGVPLPVDPGAHRITAEAPGHSPIAMEIVLGEGQTLTVALPALQVLRAAGPAAAPGVDRGASRAAPAEEAFPLRPLGWTLVGLGAASFLTGAAAGFVAIGEEQAAENAGCDDDTCPPAGLSHSDTAGTAASLANVLLPVGLALAGGGLVLVVLGAPAEAPAGAAIAFARPF